MKNHDINKFAPGENLRFRKLFHLPSREKSLRVSPHAVFGSISSRKNRSGLTLVELLISVLILIPIFTIGMQTFIKCIELSDMAQNSSLTVQEIKSRVSAIENTAYNQIFNTYNNTTFTLTGLTGIGNIYVDNSNLNHLIINISFCWRERSGRVVGEDKNLNGVLNAGEDQNGNGQIDSIAKVTTQIYNM